MTKMAKHRYRLFLSLYFLCGLADLLSSKCHAQTIPEYDNIYMLRTAISESDPQVILRGYYQAGDGGGGIFVNSPVTSCVPYSLSGTWSTNSSKISLAKGQSTTSVHVGDAIAYQQNNFPDYDIVTSFTASSITLGSNPLVAQTSNTNFSLSCDNSGQTVGTNTAINTQTMKISGAPGSGMGTPPGGPPVSFAYTRASPNFSQYEWGAIDTAGTGADYSTNLQRWLNAVQPHNALPGSVTIASPLICPNMTSIQGPPSSGVAEDSGYLPLFIINGASNFVGATMLSMPPALTCSIHSIGLIAAASGSVYNVVEAMGKSDLIDQHSYLANGYYNILAGSPGNGGGAANLEVYDSSLNNSLATNLNINSPNAKVSRNSIAASGSTASSATSNFVMQTNSAVGLPKVVVGFPVAPVAITPGLTVSTSLGSALTNVLSVSVANMNITLAAQITIPTNQMIGFSLPIVLTNSTATQPAGQLNFSNVSGFQNIAVVRGMIANFTDSVSGLPVQGYVTAPITSSGIIATTSTSNAAVGSVVTFTLPNDSSNIAFGGSEIFIANNIIQQGGGSGLILKSAKSVRVDANFFDNNGRAVSGTHAIDINSSYQASICGNTFSQSSLATATDPTYLLAGVFVSPVFVATPLPSAHVSFSGNNDNVVFCGNAYIPDQSSGNNAKFTLPSAVLYYPDYSYDVVGGTGLTNITISDNSAPQMVGIASSNAVQLLSGSFDGGPTLGSITGLSMRNSGTTAVYIGKGSATDSTGTTTISLSQQCIVDLGAKTAGPHGLDTLSSTISTIYFFVISGPGGTHPTCMASTNPTPSFANAGSNFVISGTGVVTSGSSTVINFTSSNGVPSGNPLAGVLPGDVITDSAGYLSGAQVSSTINPKVVNVVATLSGNSSAAVTPPVFGLIPGMIVSGAGVAPPPAITTLLGPLPSCSSSCTLTFDTPTQASASSLLTFSGSRGILATLPATASAPSDNLTVTVGRFRLVGVLYTTTTANAVVPFTQINDTFYLATPVQDVNLILPATAKLFQLSVPCGRNVTCGSNGVSVQAIGRIVATNPVLVSSPLQSSSLVATNFGSGIGYSSSAYVQTATPPQSAFGFQLYTDPQGNIFFSAATTATATATEVTDGWRFQR